MHALHSNQAKTQNPQSQLQPRSHVKRRVETLLTVVKFANGTKVTARVSHQEAKPMTVLKDQQGGERHG